MACLGLGDVAVGDPRAEARRVRPDWLAEVGDAVSRNHGDSPTVHIQLDPAELDYIILSLAAADELAADETTPLIGYLESKRDSHNKHTAAKKAKAKRVKADAPRAEPVGSPGGWTDTIAP